MERVYVFLIRNDVWIYIICGLGLLWYLNELISSQRTLSRAMFGLERETALRTRNAALLMVLIFASVAGIVIYVNSQIRPLLPPELFRAPTPTVSSSFGPTILPTETPPEIPASPTSPIAPTVTLPGAPAGLVTDTITGTGTITDVTPLPIEASPLPSSPTPTSTSGPPVSGCTPDAIITEPREGAAVLGLLNLFGSANTDDFAFYEIEISGPQTNDRWASLVGRRIEQPVTDGILAGNVNLSAWMPGEYEIRLIISNSDEQVTHQCGVSILLQTTEN